METQPQFTRPLVTKLLNRLLEPRRFIQVVIGGRQVGKTTLARQVAKKSRIACHYVTADVPWSRNLDWIAQQWDIARQLARNASDSTALLILDEVQKVPNWSESVKWLWDADSMAGLQVKVVVLGSTPLLAGRGLTESLAGRFEILHLPHWSFSEMHQAFNFSLNQYLFYGGYPGAVAVIDDLIRWSDYIHNSLLEPAIARDILTMTRIDKPALLRQLFQLGCAYSGQVLSYNKMLRQLQDAGNSTTLAHYLDLLGKAGLLTGLQKFAGQIIRRRGSSPRLQVLNTALMTVAYERTIDEALNDPAFKGRLVESAVGAHLVNAAVGKKMQVYYWRENNQEVDFVIETGSTLTAIEVKSGRKRSTLPGISAFSKAFKPTRVLVIGEGGFSISEFLSNPVEHWIS